MEKMPILILSMALVLCASCTQKDVDRDVQVTKAKQHQVSLPTAEELPSLRSQAMGGSAAAAMRLSLWHMQAMQREEDMFWTRIAAENGSAVAQFNLAQKLLADSSNDLNKIRARFWLRLSAEQGDIDAKKMLDSLADR